MRRFLLCLLLLAAPAMADTVYRYEGTVQNVRGDAVSAATITVYKANTSTKATLYSGYTTAIGTKNNPVYSDGYGRYYFYVPPGTYDLAISRAGIVSYTLEDVVVSAINWDPDKLGIYNIVNFGAEAISGTDSTDCTTYIQAAIDSCSSAGGGMVLVPAGAYFVGSTIELKEGVILMGSAPNLKPMTSGVPGEVGSVLVAGMYDGSAVISVDTQGWGVYWLGINGNGNDCTGIETADNISPDHPHHWRIDSCDIYDCTYGLDLYDAYIGQIVGSNIRQNTTGVRGDTVNGVLFSGCAIEHNDNQAAISNSDGLTFSGCVIEGHNTTGVSLEGCLGVTFSGCYFEGNGGASDLWFVKAGFTTQCEEILISGGRASRVGGDGSAHMFEFDDVLGVTLESVSIDARWEHQIISTTSNTERVHFDCSVTGAVLTDGSNTINPAYNYWPDPMFYRGSGAVEWTLTNATVTDTTASRTGGSAVKIESDGSGDSSSAAYIRLSDPVLDAFKGRRIRCGVWVYVPSVSTYTTRDGHVQVGFYGAVGGSYAGWEPNNNYIDGAWNYFSAYADVNGSETALDVRVYVLYPGETTTVSDEYVIIDNLVVTDGYADRNQLAAGNWIPYGDGTMWLPAITAEPDTVGKRGLIWFDSTNSTFKGYNGSGWQAFH